MGITDTDNMEKKVYPSIKDTIILLIILCAALRGLSKLFSVIGSAFKTGWLFFGVSIIITAIICMGLVLLIGFKK